MTERHHYGHCGHCDTSLALDDDEIYRLWQDMFNGVDKQMVWGPIDAWQPTGLITSLKVSTTEPEAASRESGVEFDFDFPSTALLAVDEAPPPVMAPVELDMDEINRLAQRGPQQTRWASRRIDPRRSQ